MIDGSAFVLVDGQ